MVTVSSVSLHKKSTISEVFTMLSQQNWLLPMYGILLGTGVTPGYGSKSVGRKPVTLCQFTASERGWLPTCAVMWYGPPPSHGEHMSVFRVAPLRDNCRICLISISPGGEGSHSVSM